MKRFFIKIVIGICFLFAINNITYAAEFQKIDFSVRSGHSVDDGGYYKTNDTYWTGREWLRSGRERSVDLVNWDKYILNDEMKIFLEGKNIKYLWDGESYIAYNNSNTSNNTYLYRISDDFNEILETYDMPYKIYNMNKVQNEYYIQAYKGSIAYTYEVYKSSDLINWDKLDYSELPETNNSCWSIMPQYNIVNYINGFKPEVSSSDLSIICGHNMYNINYENFSSKRIAVSNGYYFSQTQDADNNLLCVSLDGVYWTNIAIPDYITNVVEIFEYGDDKIIAMSEQIENNRRIVYNLEFDKSNFLLSLSNKLFQNTPHIILNNQLLGFSEIPIIENGRTLVPMRFLFEQMGADVNWNAETQTATATLDNTAVTFAIDDIEAEVNSRLVKMDVPARLVNGKTMIPLRFLSEELGFTVTWNEEIRTAVIDTDP